MNISARHLYLIAACLLAPLAAAVGVAWACVPTARTAVVPTSGPAGSQVRMTGDGFPPNTVAMDIYLDSRTPANLVKDDLPVTPTGTGDKTFATQLTMPSTLGAHLVIPVPRDANGDDVGTLSSGAGPPAAVFQVTDPSLSLLPAAGSSGTRALVSGTAFKSGTIKIRWGSAAGPQLGSATATGAGFTFSTPVTIPNAPAGDHKVVAVPFGDPSDSASATFKVTAPPPPLVAVKPLYILADTAGPTISSRVLTSRNGTKRVSKRGFVTLFCGTYNEDGVTGTCGARSVRKLTVPPAGASRRALLRLGTKSFSAQRAKPVKVKFRLKKSAMRMLKKAKKVRMRGSVTARDAKGNSRSAPFRFTLKAPKKGS